jgi:hypothetical protein
MVVEEKAVLFGRIGGKTARNPIVAPGTTRILDIIFPSQECFHVY